MVVPPVVMVVPMPPMDGTSIMPSSPPEASEPPAGMLAGKY
jgi:hypothetical protein